MQHPRKVQSLRSKDTQRIGSFPTICKKVIEMFKDNVPQRKTGRDLEISLSTGHKIIKRFKECGGFLVRKGQGGQPKLNKRDL